MLPKPIFRLKIQKLVKLAMYNPYIICNFAVMEQDYTSTSPLHEEVKKLKQLFFAYRNGIIADTLRNAGDCHATIFGLNIPQLVEIATQNGQNIDVARAMWENTSCRESRLFAPMIFPCAEMSHEEAGKWIESVENIEIADNLCHKLLKKLPFAQDLVTEYAYADSDIVRYTALRLSMNLLCIDAVTDKQTLLDAAKRETMRDCMLTRNLCLEIISEISSQAN